MHTPISRSNLYQVALIISSREAGEPGMATSCQITADCVRDIQDMLSSENLLPESLENRQQQKLLATFEALLTIAKQHFAESNGSEQVFDYALAAHRLDELMSIREIANGHR